MHIRSSSYGRYAIVCLGLMAASCSVEPTRPAAYRRQLVTDLQVSSLCRALDRYKSEVGVFPTTTEGLGALVKNYNDSSRWHGPYLRRIPQNAWGEGYGYVRRDDGMAGIRRPSGQSKSAPQGIEWCTSK